MERGEGSRARRLPAGAHGLPRDVVERNQRERLIAAMAEVSAEKGYGETSVADVSRQAGVSTASFYKQFAGRQECMLASFDELFGRLAEAVGASCGEEDGRQAKVRCGIVTASDLLGNDIPSARLLTVEILAVGPPGARLQHAAIERLADQLRVEWARVAGAVALVARRVLEGEGPAAAELEEALLG